MSTTASRAEPGADTVLVDYAMVHVDVQPINEGQERYGGWKVMTVNVQLLWERRFCSRTFPVPCPLCCYLNLHPSALF
jgi:hypothetical protein